MRAVALLATQCTALASAVVLGQAVGGTAQADDSYLTWTSAQAMHVGRSTRVNGRVGGIFDLRVVHTEHSYNYKLRATWLTPEVIRATARLAQLADRLGNEQAEALVAEAGAVGDTVIMLEIDPREGSGVVPLDWTASFGPTGSQPGEAVMVKGRNQPGLRGVRALAGVFRRDYNYESFWLVFPLTRESGEPLFPHGASEQAELVVRIYNKEGRVKWAIPESVKRRNQAG